MYNFWVLFSHQGSARVNFAELQMVIAPSFDCLPSTGCYHLDPSGDNGYLCVALGPWITPRCQQTVSEALQGGGSAPVTLAFCASALILTVGNFEYFDGLKYIYFFSFDIVLRGSCPSSELVVGPGVDCGKGGTPCGPGITGCVTFIVRLAMWPGYHGPFAASVAAV